MPVGDLGGPAGDGATQLVDLGWARFVLEVVGELEGVSESKDRTVDAVDAPDRLLCVLSGAHLPVGITSIEETTQPGLTAVADLLMRGGEEAAYPIQRVIFAASMPGEDGGRCSPGALMARTGAMPISNEQDSRPGLMPLGWGGGSVVVRGRESRAHGEGVQCVRSRPVNRGGRW